MAVMKNEQLNPMKTYDVLDSALDYLSRARAAPPARMTSQAILSNHRRVTERTIVPIAAFSAAESRNDQT
jgi:hypothetical protein